MTTQEPDTPQESDQQAIPPYDGRRTSADVDPEGDAQREGARVGGATGPVESAAPDAAEAAPTGLGDGVSPAQEQPAQETADTQASDEGVGPAHTTGVPKGEDEAKGG
jgi:hypothetical protein